MSSNAIAVAILLWAMMSCLHCDFCLGAGMLSGSQDTAEEFKCLILTVSPIANSNDTHMTPEARTRTPMNSQKQLTNGSHTLNDIRAFVAVVEAGGFSQAGRRLGLSQPAISQRVRNFENSCGLRLLDRRGVPELTAAGREIFHRARLVLARAEELDTTVADLRGLRAGRISFGYATPAFAIPLIARFRVTNPGIVVDYHYGNTAETVRRPASVPPRCCGYHIARRTGGPCCTKGSQPEAHALCARRSSSCASRAGFVEAA